MVNDEAAFQAYLDAHPDDHQTRMIFADWLEDRDDPRAAGYREMGRTRRHAVRLQSSQAFSPTWSFYKHDPDYHEVLYSNGLPAWWSMRLGDRHVHPSRREAEDAAALAFRPEFLTAASEAAV